MRFFKTAGLMVAMLWWVGSLKAAVHDVKGIDIIVKKVPTGHAIRVTVGDGGTVRFELRETGTYAIEAYKAAGTNGRDHAPYALSGNFTRRGPGSDHPVSGATVDGNTLFAAGADRGEGGLLFSTGFTVNAPVTFVGQLQSDDDISVNARHLTYYSVVNGPQTPTKTLTISNHSASTASYTAAFEVVGAARWTASLSASSGSITSGSSEDIEVRPQAGLGVGEYNGFLRFRLQTSDGIVEKAVAMTLFVQAPGNAKGTSILDNPMTALYPLYAGGFETSTFQVTNNGATSQTYSPRPDTGLTVTPAQLTVGPGETGTFTTHVDAIQTVTGAWVKRCIPVLTSTGVFQVKCYWIWMNASVASASCTPTSLQPVITKLNPQVARAGHPLDVTIQVYDNCGGQLSDFTAKMSASAVSNGQTEAHIATVQSSGRAITKGGQSGFDFTSTRLRAALAYAAPEFQLDGYLYPYFTVGDGGVTLTVDVEAPSALGGDVLTGSVSMPLEYDFDPNAPLVAQNAFVSNASYQRVPLTPLSIFALFTVIPGLPGEDARAVPFPETLGGVQVLIDGKGKVPLIRARSGLVPGTVPYDIADGEHLVNLVYNGRMSGAITFNVARAGATPIFADTQEHAHLYDLEGRLNSQTNPIKVNQPWVFYGGDFGRIKGPELTTGAVSPAVLMPAELECTLTIGDNPAKLDYCGLSPGSVVLYQGNFTLPAIVALNAKDGDIVELPIVIDQAGYKGTTNALGWFQVNSAQSVINISVQANYPDAKFSVNGNLIAGNTGLLTFNAGTSIPLNAPADPQVPSAGTRYYFNGWSQGGNRVQSIAPTVSTAYGVNFLASYLLTINGSATVQPPSSDGYYTQTPSVFIPVKVTGSCPGGAVPLGLLVKTGLTSKSVPNGSTITMDKPVNVSVVCPPPVAPITSCIVPPSGLVGWWALDELTGTVAKNFGSVASADGIYTNNPSSLAAGKVAGAYDFSNAGSVVVSNQAAFDFPKASGAFSVDAWVRGTGLGSSANQHIVMKHTLTSQGSGGYDLFLRNGLLSLHLHDETTKASQDLVEPVPTHAPVNDGNWHLVAATVDFTAKQGYLYFDGVPVLSFVLRDGVNNLLNTFPLMFGAVVGPNAFLGQIDEVEVFDRALAATEVQNLYRADKFGKCKPTTSYLVTISGCGATVGPQALAIGTNTFPANSNLVVTANPSSGGLVNISITMGGTTKVYTSSPVNLTLTGPATIVAACPAKPNTCIVAPAGMVGWYSLDETGGLILADSTSNPAHLTRTGDSRPTAGKVLGGWEFINNLDYAESAASPAKYNFGAGDFSVDTWASLVGNTSTPFITKMTTAGNPAGFMLSFDNNRLRLDLGDGSATTARSWIGTRLVGGSGLHHMTVSVSRTDGPVFYVDGVIDPFSTTSAMPTGSLNNNAPFRLGATARVLTLDEVEVFNRTLTASEAQQLFLADSFGKCKGAASCPAGSAVLSTAAMGAMKGWWSLESGSGTISDRLGLNSGTSIGNLPVTGGKVGSALMFSGTGSDLVSIPYKADFDILGAGTPGTGMTLDGWIKIDPNSPVDGTIFSNRRNGGNAAYSFGYSSSQGLVTYIGWVPGFSSEQYDLIGSSLFITDNNWHFVAFRATRIPNGTTYDFWLDGVKKTADRPEMGNLSTKDDPYLGTFPTGTPLYIGGYGYLTNYQNAFTGAIDELEFFNQPISDTDIAAVYNAGAVGKCDPRGSSFPITVNTNPAGIGATVGLQPGGTAPNVYTNPSAVAGTYTATVSPATITGVNTEYRLKTSSTWSLNGVTNPAWNNLTTTLATNRTATSTFTANFDTYHKVTLAVTGCTVQNNAGIPATGGSGFVLAGSSVSASFSAGAGNVILTATLNGLTQPIPSNAPFTVNVNSLNGSLTTSATCAPSPNSNVTLTVATNPPGLSARIGTSGAYAAAPIVQQVPANQSQTISVLDPQLVGNTGYGFTGWSTGGSTPTTTVNPPSNFTATANFAPVCYKLTVSANPSNGGTVAKSPASGLIAPDCYAAGSVVTLTATPAAWFTLTSWTGPGLGTNPRTVTMSAPVTLIANFEPAAPGTISSVSPPIASGGSYRSNIFFTNPLPTPGQNLKITNVTFQTTGGTGTVTYVGPMLPLVFGALLPNGGQSSTQSIQYNIPPTVTNFIVNLTVTVENPTGFSFTVKPAAGLNGPF